MKTLTVFTPTYNRAHTLGRTYESLCRQTLQDFEWLVIDDGSTDGTRALVESWQHEARIPIRYIYKENGGLYTGYNTAYANINTELNVCIDSDDFMPDDAVEIIVSEWRHRGSNQYAGLLGLDFELNGEPIGGYFPEGMTEAWVYDFRLHKTHMGDCKPVFRSELTRQFSPMQGFQGEKNFNPHYIAMAIEDEYPMLIVNKNLCYVEYQANDSMSAGIYNQYFNSPRSFSQTRRREVSLKHNTLKNRIRVSIHYVATSIIAHEWNYITTYPEKWLAVLCTPPGILLYLYLKHKRKNG